MSFNHTELITKLKEVEKELGMTLSPELAQTFVALVDGKKDGMPFREALRFSLNELYIYGEEQRRAYRKIAGKLFGSHGGRKAAQNRKQGIPPQKPKQRVTGSVFEEKSGQFALRI